MSAAGFVFIVSAALVTAISNILLRIGVKRAGGFGVSQHGLFRDLANLSAEPAFILGVLLYGVAALIWFRVVSTENLATGYVLLVSVAFISVTVGASLVFREPMTAQKIIGMGVILTGIILVARAT